MGLPLLIRQEQVLLTFTSSDNSVTITGSTNTIDFKSSGSVIMESLTVDAHTAPGTNPVVPLAGTITLEGGATYATNTRANPIRTNSLAANKVDLEIQLAGSNASTASANKFGVAQFDANSFTVTSGFVQFATAPMNSITVDAHTAPGTNPVVPSSGTITMEGGATFATGTQAHPIRTNSLAANTIDLQIQLAGSNAASSTPNNFGVAQFDSNDFTVTNGFVQLSGGDTSNPGFFVYLSANQTNVTGDGSQVKVTFNTKLYDVATAFNTSTNTFTAPSTGKYWLTANVWFDSPNTSSEYQTFVNITSTARTYWSQNFFQASALTQPSTILTVLADMTAGDTATVNAGVNGGVSKDASFIQNGASDPRSYFCGYRAF